MSDNIAQWRWICLEKQLPPLRFRTGITRPVALCMGSLVLVSVLCVAYLGGSPDRSVARAVIESQEQLVGRLARSEQTGVAAARAELIAAADGYAADSSHAVEPLLAPFRVEHTGWLGAALLEPGSRKPVAMRGEPVGLDRLPQPVTSPQTTPVVNAGADAAVTFAVPLVDGRLLVASTALRIRRLALNADAHQGVCIGTEAGATADAQGVVASSNRVTRALVRRALAGTRGRRAATAIGESALTVRPSTGRQVLTAPVVAAAPIGDLGIAVVSMSRADVQPGGSRLAGVPVAASLLAAVFVTWVLIRFFLVAPVRRLAVQAKRVACGEPNPGCRRPRIAEVARVSAAFDAVAARLEAAPAGGFGAGGFGAPPAGGFGAPPARPARRWFRLRLGVVLVVATMPVVGWGGVVGFAYSRSPVELPKQLADDARNLTDGAAIAVRECLGAGLARVTGEATGIRAADANSGWAAVDRLTAADGRFRSVYLADSTGVPDEGSGAPPLRHTRKPPAAAGIFLDSSGGRVPVIYAAAPVAGGRTLVAEFNIHHLIGLLDSVGGRLRVVDSRLRVLLDTEGYVPFLRLPEAGLRAAARQALAGGPRASHSMVTTVAGVRALVTTTMISPESGPVPRGLALVAQRPVSAFRLARNDLRRGAWLAAFLGLGVALAQAGWYAATVRGPLRALGAAADRLAAGDITSVINAVRYDELGAIAICLDLCRQAALDGPHRLGGATRYRGPGPDTGYGAGGYGAGGYGAGGYGFDDRTMVLPCVPVPAPGRQHPVARRGNQDRGAGRAPDPGGVLDSGWAPDSGGALVEGEDQDRWAVGLGRGY